MDTHLVSKSAGELLSDKIYNNKTLEQPEWISRAPGKYLLHRDERA